jgi:hypothetical protein
VGERLYLHDGDHDVELDTIEVGSTWAKLEGFEFTINEIRRHAGGEVCRQTVPQP